MLTFINTKRDYPLTNFFKFDIFKTIRPQSFTSESSLTLGCSFERELKPTLFLTKQENNIENVNMKLMVQSAAKEMEAEIRLDQQYLKIEHALVYNLTRNLKCKDDHDELATLRKKYCFLKIDPDINKTDIDSCIFNLQTKDLIPVIVFPEKNNYLSKRATYITKLRQRNCAFQCDLLALTGLHGTQVKHTVTTLLENNLIDFFGLELKALVNLKGVDSLRIPRKIADLLSKRLLIQI